MERTIQEAHALFFKKFALQPLSVAPFAHSAALDYPIISNNFDNLLPWDANSPNLFFGKIALARTAVITTPVNFKSYDITINSKTIPNWELVVHDNFYFLGLETLYIQRFKALGNYPTSSGFINFCGFIITY